MSRDGIHRIARWIRAWASETGLEWWVDLVTSEFRYLERYGFRVEETHLHFLGNYIRYRNPLYDLVISYEPESTATLEATLQRRTDGEPSPVLLNALILQHAPEAVAPQRLPLVRTNVQATVRFWAKGLQGIADELFGGQP